jgi:putative ABC transport system permease protein
MIPRLAWRNIWRNRRRSLIVLVAIAIGLVTLAVTDSVYNGVMVQMFEDQVGTHVTHLQVHRAGFNDNKVIQNWLPDRERVDSLLRTDPRIKAHSPRIVAFGIASSAANSSGISIVGVDPEAERTVTTIARSVISGTYLKPGERTTLISRRLAEKLDVRLGDKVVVMATTLDGDVGADVFRVCGLFETTSSEFDRAYLYIPLAYAQGMLGLGDRITEYAALMHDPSMAPEARDRLRNALGHEYEALSYAELIPMMMQLLDIFKQSMIIYYLIIGIATMFGIVNAQLMSVYERTRELGILMATGMKNRSIVGMILLEAFFLSLLGTVIGLAVGLGISFTLAYTGIDLSIYAEGLTLIGASSTIYPAVSIEGILNGLTIIPVIAVIAALYPALRAIRLEPVRAIQYV